MSLEYLLTSFLCFPPFLFFYPHVNIQNSWNGFTYRSSLYSLVLTCEYEYIVLFFLLLSLYSLIETNLCVMSSLTAIEGLSENPILCSIDQCATPFDVHCFHCRVNMCSHHYFEHKQQQSSIQNDDAMDDLLQLASSKYFCISNSGHSISKSRRSFSNPFVSSSYLLKKMRQQAARRPDSIKPVVTTKTTAIKFYNLRKRPGTRQRKLVATKTTTVTTTTVKLCRTVIKTRLRNNKLCNRKLPCPYHTVE